MITNQVEVIEFEEVSAVGINKSLNSPYRSGHIFIGGGPTFLVNSSSNIDKVRSRMT